MYYLLRVFECRDNVTIPNTIADWLAALALKNPLVAEEVAFHLTDANQNDRQRAAKILRAIGKSAEKAVQKVAAANPRFAAPELIRRFEAIELLGDIGTQDSLTYLLALKGEPEQSQQWIDNAVNKIRMRTGGAN